MLKLLKKFGGLKVHHKIAFAIIAGFGGVMFWRGAWGLFDRAFGALLGTGTPENFFASMTLGILLLLFTGAFFHMTAVD